MNYTHVSMENYWHEKNVLKKKLLTQNQNIILHL